MILEVMGFECSAWLVGPIETFKIPSDETVVKDARGRPVALFRSPWSKSYAQKHNPNHTLLDMG